MSDLPDIDTDDVSFIAFYNAIEQGGASEIEPEQVLDQLESYTTYDNGFEGTYEIGRSTYPQVLTVRMKTDGWVVAYLDREENYNQNIQPGVENAELLVRGPWNVIDWLNKSASLEENTLAKTINSLCDNLDNSDEITFFYEDVGLYNYAYENAEAVTVMGLSGSSGTLSFANLNILWQAAAAWMRVDESGTADGAYGEARIEDEDWIVRQTGVDADDDEEAAGTMNLDNVITEPQTDYVGETDIDSTFGDWEDLQMVYLALWESE